MQGITLNKHLMHFFICYCHEASGPVSAPCYSKGYSACEKSFLLLPLASPRVACLISTTVITSAAATPPHNCTEIITISWFTACDLFKSDLKWRELLLWMFNFMNTWFVLLTNNTDGCYVDCFRSLSNKSSFVNNQSVCLSDLSIEPDVFYTDLLTFKVWSCSIDQ